jgi:hypothetical protein
MIAERDNFLERQVRLLWGEVRHGFGQLSHHNIVD